MINVLQRGRLHKETSAGWHTQLSSETLADLILNVGGQKNKCHNTACGG